MEDRQKIELSLRGVHLVFSIHPLARLEPVQFARLSDESLDSRDPLFVLPPSCWVLLSLSLFEQFGSELEPDATQRVPRGPEKWRQSCAVRTPS